MGTIPLTLWLICYLRRGQSKSSAEPCGDGISRLLGCQVRPDVVGRGPVVDQVILDVHTESGAEVFHQRHDVAPICDVDPPLYRAGPGSDPSLRCRLKQIEDQVSDSQG